MSLENKIKLKENERIVFVIRRYGLTLFWRWLLISALLAVPFFFMFWLFQHGWWGEALFVIPMALGLFLAVRAIFIWQKNIFIVTTHRLVDIDQRDFFEQIISEVPYDQVEDVGGRISGFWGTILRYGNLSVQTGNGKVKIVVDKIKNPIYLQQEINEFRQQFISKYAHDFSGNVANVIIDKLYELELSELIRVAEILNKRINKLI
ncbi:MAG: hypothetical protein WC862_01655 [Patescibacteria group bacterium]